MDPTDLQLRDCGHVGPFTGVCQYDGCAKQLCSNCIQACETCGTILCPAHQVWLDERRRVFCPDHSTKYLLLKLARAIIPGLGTTDNEG
jgi:hypothetical protein